ncbi:hypothetical protein ABZ092_10095, partial [Streptomyces bobili]|uniref:hypothetical protein n=1 Tax=Streptomyces bobili TaxID=67280 RepID=UPI00339F8CCF
GVLASWRPGVLASWRPGVLASWRPGVLASWRPGVLTGPQTRAVGQGLRQARVPIPDTVEA